MDYEQSLVWISRRWCSKCG